MKKPWVPIGLIISFVLCAFLLSHAAQHQEKSKVRLSLDYFKYSPNDRYLNIKLLTRKERRYIPVEGVKIEFYLSEKSTKTYLGSLVTDQDGQGSLFLSEKFYVLADTLLSYTFIATLTDSPDYLETVTELDIIDASIEVNGLVQGTQRVIQAIVRDKDSTGALVVVPDVYLTFLVERPLCLLPISDIIGTDEKGIALSNFPTDLPGDREGYVTVLVKIDDHESYGTVLQRETIRWGIPTYFDDESQKRSLWAARSNTPIPLLLLVNGLILVTWGIMVYITRELLRIKSV